MFSRVASSSVSMTMFAAGKPKLSTSISRRFVTSFTQPFSALPGYLLMPTSIAYFAGAAYTPDANVKQRKRRLRTNQCRFMLMTPDLIDLEREGCGQGFDSTTAVAPCQL